MQRENKEDLQLLTELIEAGKVMPVIDRTFSLSEVPAAIRYLDARRVRGKVVVTVFSCWRVVSTACAVLIDLRFCASRRPQRNASIGSNRAARRAGR
jgi:hypothetical protein